jgi:hypothetical protein
MEYLESSVWKGPHERPHVHDDWVVPIKLILKHGWDKDLHSRNTMKQNCCEILRKECVRVRDGVESGLEHTKRRFTFVYRPKKAPGMLTLSRRNLVKSQELNRTQIPTDASV